MELLQKTCRATMVPKSVLWISPFYYVHIVPNTKTKNTEIHPCRHTFTCLI